MAGWMPDALPYFDLYQKNQMTENERKLVEGLLEKLAYRYGITWKIYGQPRVKWWDLSLKPSWPKVALTKLSFVQGYMFGAVRIDTPLFSFVVEWPHVQNVKVHSDSQLTLLFLEISTGMVSDVSDRLALDKFFKRCRERTGHSANFILDLSDFGWSAQDVQVLAGSEFERAHILYGQT